MNRKEVLIVALLFGFALSSTGPQLPDYLRRCKRNLPRGSLNNCLKSAIEEGFVKLKKGEPSINIKSFDPLKIEEIKISRSAVLISLDVNQKDAEVYGFGDGIKINNIDFNFDKMVFHASLNVPKLRLESFQTLAGNILGLPLTWRGGMSCNITKVKCNFNAPFSRIRKNGEEYLAFDENKLKLSLDVDHVRVHHRENSPAERIAASTADKIINDNWRLVFSVLKPSYEDIFRKEFANSLIGLFSTVPVGNIFL